LPDFASYLLGTDAAPGDALEDLSNGVSTGNQQEKYPLGGIFPRYRAAYAAVHAIDFLHLYPPIGQELVNSGSCSSPLALSIQRVGTRFV